MGLDIYLYRYENKEETEKLVAEYESKSETNWSAVGEYDKLSDEQKDGVRTQNKKMAIGLGLSEDGSDPRQTRVEIDSVKYPEHYFKVGYFRSSYNGSGINRILSNLGLDDLYDIFSKSDEEYCFRPDWQRVKDNATIVLSQLRSKPNYRCFEVSGNELSGGTGVSSEREAIDKAISQDENNFDSDGYSNIDGHFYPKGLKVFAILPGTRKGIFNYSVIPTSYIVIEGENEWYCQALEIIIETCDYVLSQADKDKYYIHWSG